jgi:hypothetical protein
VYKPAIAPRWAGVEADVPEIPLDLYPVMTRKVFCSDTGAVSFMLDDVDLPPGVDRYRIFVEYGPEDVNTWVQLVFDFSGRSSGVYERLRFTHNHYGPSYTSDTEYWYFDEVMAWSNLSTSTSAEVSITETVTVYPNPSLDWFYVETKDIFPVGSTYDLEVLDVQGRSVLRREVFAEGQPVALDLSTQPAGLYFVRLSGQSLRYVKAISKME